MRLQSTARRSRTMLVVSAQLPVSLPFVCVRYPFYMIYSMQYIDDISLALERNRSANDETISIIHHDGLLIGVISCNYYLKMGWFLVIRVT